MLLKIIFLITLISLKYFSVIKLYRQPIITLLILCEKITALSHGLCFFDRSYCEDQIHCLLSFPFTYTDTFSDTIQILVFVSDTNSSEP